MAGKPNCKSSDPFRCHSFRLQQVWYVANTCDLPSNVQGEIKIEIECRRPAGSTEENCKWILIAGSSNNLLKELQFSINRANPDFQNHEGYIEIPDDRIDPSKPNSPVPREFLVKYVGTTKRKVTVHCKLRHGDSVDECELCTEHQVDLYLDIG